MSVIKKHYATIENWEDKRYIGMHMRWDHKGKQVHTTTPGYVEKALKAFCHEQPRKRQDSAYTCTPERYGVGAQVMEVQEVSRI
jgi:polyhydroxyalkanoate synthesis regulator protein